MSVAALWARDAKHVSSFVGNESSRRLCEKLSLSRFRRHAWRESCTDMPTPMMPLYTLGLGCAGVYRGVPGGRGSDAPKVRAMDVRLKILWRLGTAEQGRVKLQLTTLKLRTLKLRTGWIQRRA